MIAMAMRQDDRQQRRIGAIQSRNIGRKPAQGLQRPEGVLNQAEYGSHFPQALRMFRQSLVFRDEYEAANVDPFGGEIR